MNIVQSALKYKHVTLSTLLMLFAVGVNSLLHMPRREDPKITIRQGLVIAGYPGASSVQVEDQVTKKLEQYLFQYAEVDKKKTYSTTKDGIVVINVELTAQVRQPDIFWNKLRHQLLIAREVDLPKGVQGPLVNSDFGDTEAMIISLDSRDATYEELKTYAQKLEDLIRTLSATSKVKRIGDQQEEIVVSATSGKLSQYGLNLGQVVGQLQSQNAVDPSGAINTDRSKTPLYTNGYFHTEQDLAGQIIGAAPGGATVRLSDLATLQRKYADPDNLITVNGNKAILLAIQMHEGNNIVDFGKAVNEQIAVARALTPSSIHITRLVSQPELVDKNISHFIREFFLAIVSVIVVVVLLLPFRIASVAAMAIPMTVALTFAVMNALGIELHQVSLAALILVLGMVVDDAIVIADNYVELLDHGVERWTAAWRSASDLLIPVLAATITIIASFMPMIMIGGATGEFIFSLPITVAIALVSSFFVALFLTPLLCFTFIKRGLHSPGDATRKSRKSFLTYMQEGYNTALGWCVRHPRITVIGSVTSIVLALVVVRFGVRELFFPPAERNQLVVELWMPTGTKLERTNEAILKAEALIKDDKRVLSYATFTGTAAPRFYYNFTPEFPTTNYAQILVNTTSEKTTEELAEALSSKVGTLDPAGTFFVKQMQQGDRLKAPVEVRIVGDDLGTLRSIGAQVAAILKKVRGSRIVRNDYAEDYYGIGVSVTGGAQRLGFTTGSIAQSLYTGFSGAAISTLYEGNKPVRIVFRLDEEDRQNTQDVANIYLTSPVTHSEVPLRQIATLVPQWQPGSIVHRNGVRTLTVQSETTPDVLPAELLASIRPAVQKIPLPPGYRIEYGGEEANKSAVMGEMIGALLVSLVLIFFILLFQFRNIKEVLIIMLTIPLSLFGAAVGLFVTHNNFSFTAFIGLISLSGIVVRNAIILVDHTNALIREGMDIRVAAVEAAQRRLRPIFLTAMAAAIGVLPMIISRSAMWAPLASVLAFGVVWSMIMALLTVPILYMEMIRPKDKSEILNNHKKPVTNEA